MKRTIDGVVYSTTISTKLARSESTYCYEHQDFPCYYTLYQTRGGAFFLVMEVKLVLNDNRSHITMAHFSVICDIDAQEWISSGELEIFSNLFDEPPQAVAENRRSATILPFAPVGVMRE